VVHPKVVTLFLMSASLLVSVLVFRLVLLVLLVRLPL
jgi:hypothetical protein